MAPCCKHSEPLFGDVRCNVGPHTEAAAAGIRMCTCVCGAVLQAFGAKKYRIVGVVLQRALLIVTLFNLVCAVLLSKVCQWGRGAAVGL